MTGAEILAQVNRGLLLAGHPPIPDGCVLLTAEEAAKMSAWIDKAAEYLIATGAVIGYQEAGDFCALLTPDQEAVIPGYGSNI